MQLRHTKTHIHIIGLNLFVCYLLSYISLVCSSFIRRIKLASLGLDGFIQIEQIIFLYNLIYTQTILLLITIQMCNIYTTFTVTMDIKSMTLSIL
jgi:hypothetical protein